MANGLLAQIDYSKHDVVVLAIGRSIADVNLFGQAFPFNLITANQEDGAWAVKKIFNFIENPMFDVVFFVGFDIYRYHTLFDNFNRLKLRYPHKVIYLFPYELQDVRFDWVRWFNKIDYPLVYSLYGYDQLIEHVPKLRYFRPPMVWAEKYLEPSKSRREVRERWHIGAKDGFLFGFVGVNMVRKSIHRLLEAFGMVLQKQQAFLYLHTNIMGDFNIRQLAADNLIRTGYLTIADPNALYTPDEMAEIYLGLDCYVNCTMQEGLSWTVLNAMSCGTPVIASDTSAHPELLGDQGILVPQRANSYLPVFTENGASFVKTKECVAEDISEAMLRVLNMSEADRTVMGQGLQQRAKSWMANVSNINELFDEIAEELKGVVRVPIEKREEVDYMAKPEITPRASLNSDDILFAQHSSAGDVLMTTQCFKGLKEKHKGKRLVYMTQGVFRGIVEGNPYIDEIIDWDEQKLQEYSLVYNPHGERIMPGGFNSLDTKLYEMYPYFCKIKTVDDLFIECVKPTRFEQAANLPEKYIVVHTTGGHVKYRTYRHMNKVIKGLPYPVVQIGGKHDLVVAGSNVIDLRGLLEWKETAYVMKHAMAAVVIDSFPSHLAGALGTPVVVLYGPAPARVVGPKVQHGGKLINMEPNKLDVCQKLTNCWGEANCETPCINTLSPFAIRKALLSLLGVTE